MIEIILYIVGGLIGLLILFAVVMHIIGRGMDPNHIHVCTMRLNQSPDAVFRAVDDVVNWGQWDKGVTRVDMLPPTDGKETCRMLIGRNPMILVTTRREPPGILERTIQDTGKHQMFTGSWFHEITPEGSGCRVKLTERGTIHMALPRAMARKLADPKCYLKRHMERLAQKFGEQAKIE